MVLNKIKDFIYNFNDLVVAVLILLIACGVIVWRVADIMDYPEYLAAQVAATTVEKAPETEVDFTGVDLDPVAVADITANPEEITTDVTQPEETTASEETTPAAPAAATGDTKISIPSGSYASQVADILYSNGLITSTKDFLALLASRKADTKLKAGDFTIPAGSTMDAIIDILIK